jgi:hypothetical protein
MPNGVVITASGFSPEWDVGPEWKLAHWDIAEGIPEPARLAGLDNVVAVGPFPSNPQASELGGALRLFADSGTTVAFLYPGNVEGPDKVLFDQLLPDNPGLGHFAPPAPAPALEPVFNEYLTAYGRSGTYLASLTETTAPLGGAPDRVAAFVQIDDHGSIYVLPYFVGDFTASYNAVIGSVLRAIAGHGSGSDDALPQYVEGLLLPGEEEVLKRVATLQTKTEEAEVEAARLRNFRHLLGNASGSVLEALIIEALNLVLEDTDLTAEDREDVGAEDFWLVDRDGDIALAEAKGIGGHVRRQNVNQVDDHRDQYDLKPEEMPGLLVINVFRNTDGADAEQRSLPVSPDVVAHARRNNVLILRTRDLFFLLHQRLGGASVGQVLVGCLKSGAAGLKQAPTASSYTRSPKLERGLFLNLRWGLIR